MERGSAKTRYVFLFGEFVILLTLKLATPLVAPESQKTKFICDPLQNRWCYKLGDEVTTYRLAWSCTEVAKSTYQQPRSHSFTHFVCLICTNSKCDKEKLQSYRVLEGKFCLVQSLC